MAIVSNPENLNLVAGLRTQSIMPFRFELLDRTTTYSKSISVGLCDNHNETTPKRLGKRIMDFTPAETSSLSPQQHQQQLPIVQNSFPVVRGSRIGNHSMASSSSASSSTPSQDKKPRARALAPSGTAITATNEVNDDCCTPSAKVGTNPFLVTTIHEREEHFPPFDDAFLNAGSDTGSSTQEQHLRNNSGIGRNTNAADLSISVLAELSEHNHHMARYGIDSSFLPEHDDNDDDDDATFPQSLFADPLDAEWERLLLHTSHCSGVDVSHISLNQSLQSVPEHLLSDDQIRITASRSPDGVENDEIEVMTEVSYSDFLNTSRTINVLRTPEHMKQQKEKGGMLPSENDRVTTRALREILSSSNQTSEASFSDDSTRKLQKLYFNALLPPIIQQRVHNDSSSMTSTPSRDSKSTDNGYTAATSFSLHNVDLSRISADGDDDDSAHIRNLDNSFGTTTGSANDNIHLLPSLIDHFDIGIHLDNDNDQTPSTTNSKSRKTIARQQIREFTVSSSMQREQHWRHDSPKKFYQASHSYSTSSPIRDLNRRSPANEPRRHAHDIPDDNASESKLEMMGLSPISRQAADTAISLLRSSPDWNRTKTTSPGRNDGSLYPNPFAADALPDFLHDTNDTSNESRSGGSDRMRHNTIKYEHQSLSTSTDNQLQTSIEDGISPLNSSSEPNNNTDSSNSGIVQNISGTETASNHLSNKHVFEMSSSSDDHLKKNSLSSISPNSSSDHHITTKPTTATNSVSSYSVTSHKSNPSTTILPPSRDPNMSSQALPKWNDRNDRRRYRTVVPIRVFIDEPHHFPNEDDSFTSLHRKLSFLSLPTTSKNAEGNGIQNQNRSERSIRSAPR